MTTRHARALLALEYSTGVLALGGGSLLVARPDGSLLHADLAELAGTPFSDWRVPGILLLVLVGGGYLLAAGAAQLRSRYAAALSVTAGVGLVGFEAVEIAWLGWQPLQLVFIAVGVAVVVLAVTPTRLRRRTGSRVRPARPPRRGLRAPR